MTSQSPAIEVSEVTRRFGRKSVLRGIDLIVREGDSLTIYGPNGAGKTTLIKVMATLLRPSAGTLKIAGLDIKENSAEIRRRIGVVGHQTFLYDELSAYENLMFYGKMYNLPDLKKRISEMISAVGMESRLHDRVRTLSRGMQQRLSIARAIIHNPSIILLDEPETGLDQYAGEMLMEVLDSLNPKKRTIVMTTHNLERGLEMGNRVAILVKGKIVYQNLKQSLNLASLQEAYKQYTRAGE